MTKKEEVLQDFLIKEDEWLQNLWLPRNSFWLNKLQSKKNKKLFEVESDFSINEPVYSNLSDLPDVIVDKLLLAINEERIRQAEKDQIDLQNKIRKRAFKFKNKEAVSKPANKCKKIYFRPDNDLKKLLSNCFGWARWAYNESVVIINNWFNNQDPDKELIKKTDLRRLVISDNKHMPFTGQGEYFNLDSDNGENNYDIKEVEVSKAYTAYKNILKLLKEREEKEEESFKPHLKFRKKKLVSRETFTFHHKYVKNTRGVYFKIFQGIESCIFSTDNYSFSEINHDFTISKTNMGRYYVCIPYYDFNVKVSEKKRDIDIVAIDPGVRTPFTCYDPFDKVSKIAEGKSKILYELAKKRDRAINKKKFFNKFKGLYSKCESLLEKKIHRKYSKKMKRVTKAAFKIQERINNLRKEFHFLTIKFLIERYQVILLPKFSASKMIKKKGRKISKQTVKEMCLWSHFSFRTRLIQKAKELGCLVILVDESYTTKTCGYCGYLNNVGPEDVITCEKCKLTLDRDVNASRNIFIKYLSKVADSTTQLVFYE